MGEAVKRAVNAVVVVLAAAAFFAVPVGRKTLAGHVVAIFSTEPAKELGTSLGAALDDARRKARLERSRPARTFPRGTSTDAP